MAARPPPPSCVTGPHDRASHAGGVPTQAKALSTAERGDVVRGNRLPNLSVTGGDNVAENNAGR